MEQKIQVLVDIYPNRFSTTEKFAYKNIRAINSNEQTNVDKYIEQMINENNELLIDRMNIIYSNSPLLPIETDRKCWFNITQKCFEFSSDQS